MKKSSEVLGLKVMGIREGLEEGVAQDFMIDSTTKKVEYLILKNSSGYGFRALKISDILGIGADYIMTATVENARKIYESKDILEVIEKGFFMLGTTALSSTGDVIGRVTDFTFDEKSGALEDLVLDDGNEFSAKTIATLAGKMVFIDPSGSDVFNTVHKDNTMAEESRTFLLGRTLKGDVISEDGEFKADSGTVLTEEILDAADKHDAVLALTLNV
ncbi:MAG: PRC-barrel domain-containing protein [Christensenellaceae bacterium]